MRLALLLPMAGMLWSAAPAQAAANGPADKGAQIYCYMRSNGNNHNVSWEASYALIKRQGSGLRPYVLCDADEAIGATACFGGPGHAA